MSVTREQGAESCPDTAQLREHVERLRGRGAAGERATYQVSFALQDGVYRATIRVGAGSGVRVLRDRGATCAALEQAVAVTLALLLDSDIRELLPEEPEPEPPRVAPPAEPPPAPRAIRERSEETSLALSLGAAGLVGVVQPVAPAALGQLGIGVSRFRTGIGVLWMPAQTLELGPGHIRETLVSGLARTCFATLRADDLHLDVCSGIFAGLLQAQAYGYTQNQSVDKAWLAIPFELSLSTTSARVGMELGVSVLVPLRRNEFSIEPLGVAYNSWPVGLMLSMRAVGTWPL